MASALYESVIVIAVVFLATLAFPGAASGRLSEWGRYALAAYVAIILGGYFVWFWTRGQTLAMRAWRLQLVDQSGAYLTWQRALYRYVVTLALIAPGLFAIGWWREHRESSVALFLMAVSVAAFGWPLWDQQRRALHDLIAGTRLVQLIQRR